MTTAARPGQFTGATDNSANGGLFTDTKIDGIPDLISADVLAAQTAATNAATSETNAATSASTATTQATNASNSATSASTSASTATTGANTATSQASTATTQAGIATTKAAAANTSAVNAAASENAAAGSATSASTSASTATSQANTATTQATNASNSATAAAASFDSLDDRYLGAKSSAPTTDNDGGTLLTGALYFNSSSNQIFSWTGSAWIAIKPTSAEQTNINTLSAAAVITDMSILATDAIVADMAILGTNDVVADMAILATNDVVADMNTLGTADVVTDMNTLGTADVVSDMNTLGTADVVSDMNTLASASNVNNMNTLAGISSAISTVSSINTDVSTVSSINAAVSTVAGMSTAINTVNSNETNVNTVSGAIANVNLVGGSITNVNTVASNIGSVNNFGEVYRIASSAPSSSLNAGDLYFNTSTNVLNVYGASGWQNAGSSVNGTSDRFHYDITGTVTAVTGNDAAGNTLAYDAGYVDVYINGVRMSTADVTTTSGDTITFAEAIVSGDEVDIVAYGTFAIASLNASNLDTGTVPLARLGSGTKNTTTFLRGDNTFATVSQESTVINNNADNRMITGSGTANTLNGEANLTFDGTTLGLTGNQTVSGTLGVTGAITGTLATAAQTNITSVGALNAGSITSGFGAIDNGASAISTTGVGSFGSLDISGNIDVDGVTNLDVVDVDGAVDFASTTAHAGNATFADNAKAIFGSELEIYSDATHARIKENGSGQLKIQGNNMQLLTSDGTATYLEGNASTGVTTLYHASNAPKLATTSTGIDVTGNVVSNDGSNNARFQFDNNNQILIQNDTAMSFYVNASASLKIDSNGAITMPNQPAFLVQPASTQSNISGTTIIDFGTEIFDQGSNFASNTFTAPVTGKYQFNLSFYLTNFDVSASYVSVYIKASNRLTETIYTGSTFGASDPTYASIAMGCLVDMDASDTCYIQIIQAGGAAQMDIQTASRFSGYLVA